LRTTQGESHIVRHAGQESAIIETSIIGHNECRHENEYGHSHEQFDEGKAIVFAYYIFE
jgi:hypothetical protein